MPLRSPSKDASSTSTGPGLMWTRDGPVLRMEDAVVETVVTHTTRTTTSFAPIPLPRIPVPEQIAMPTHLSPEAYPLANEPTPDDMRFLSLALGGRRVLVQEDGTVFPDEAGIPGETCGPGWRRTMPTSAGDERYGLAGFLNQPSSSSSSRGALQMQAQSQVQGLGQGLGQSQGHGQGDRQERKRPLKWSGRASSVGVETAMEDDEEEEEEDGPTGGGGSGGGGAMTPPTEGSFMPRQRSPPRKKIRSSEDIASPPPEATGAGGSRAGPLLSPLPSPGAGEFPPSPSSAQPSLGSGLEVAALFSLPSIITHFESLPDKVQQHVLMHLFRRSRMPTIQRISAFASTALKRDFISSLPHEIAVQVLRKVDFRSLATATRVSRKWRRMIDGERSVWRTRLMEDGLWYSHGVEEAEERQIQRRFETLEWKAAIDAERQRLEQAEASGEDVAMISDHERDHERDSREDSPFESHRATALKHVYRRRYVSNNSWLHTRPRHTSFSGHGTNVVTCVQFDSDKIVSASDDHSINIYCTKTGQLKKRLDGHEGGVWALEYKGDMLVSGSVDRTVRVWDLETLEQCHVFLGHTSTVRCLKIVEPVLDEKSGQYFPPYPVVVTGSRDKTVRVWRLPKKGDPPFKPEVQSQDPNQPQEQEGGSYFIHALEGHTESVRALAAYGRICVSGSYDTTVRVWDLVNGTCLHTLYGHEQKVYSIVYDQYRNRCVSGSMDNTVKVWDIETGTCLHTLTGHTSLVGLLGASPNYIVSAAADASLRVWDSNTHELKHVLSSHAGAITCFQHDETKVVSGSEGTLKLWDIRTGQYVRDLIVGISTVRQVAFNGHLLVAASNRAGNTVFDVFDFGAHEDPLGIDNEELDELRGPPWDQNGGVKQEVVEDEPHGGDDADMSSPVHPSDIPSPETVERTARLSVRPPSTEDDEGRASKKLRTQAGWNSRKRSMPLLEAAIDTIQPVASTSTLPSTSAFGSTSASAFASTSASASSSTVPARAPSTPPPHRSTTGTNLTSRLLSARSGSPIEPSLRRTATTRSLTPAGAGLSAAAVAAIGESRNGAIATQSALAAANSSRNFSPSLSVGSAASGSGSGSVSNADGGNMAGGSGSAIPGADHIGPDGDSLMYAGLGEDSHFGGHHPELGQLHASLFNARSALDTELAELEVLHSDDGPSQGEGDTEGEGVGLTDYDQEMWTDDVE